MGHFLLGLIKSVRADARILDLTRRPPAAVAVFRILDRFCLKRINGNTTFERASQQRPTARTSRAARNAAWLPRVKTWVTYYPEFTTFQ